MFSNQKEKKKALLVLIGFELAVVLMIVLFFLRSSFDDGNVVKKHSAAEGIPAITADNGFLQFNSVKVKVPDENASYVIGYDWTKTDKDYPTMPSSASVYYSNDKGSTLYEIVLYRDMIHSKDGSADEITLDTWFDDWDLKSEDGTSQELYKTPATNGVLVSVMSDSADDDKEKAYCSYTYYFAVETSNSIEQYVLELNCYDPASFDNVKGIFEQCAESISTDAS